MADQSTKPDVDNSESNSPMADNTALPPSPPNPALLLAVAESTTSPPLPPLLPTADGKSSAMNHQLPDNNSATTKERRTRGNYIGLATTAYSASLITVGVMMPVVASFIAVGLYLTLPNSPLPPFLGLQPSSQWYTFVYSTFLTGILWLVVAIPYCHLSTAQGANPRNYNLLRSRLHQMKASLDLKDYADSNYEEINTIDTVMEHAGFDKHNKHKWNLVKEAYACCIDISRKLYKSPVGLTWIIGTGYNSAWTLLHHAEEVMIEVADVVTVVRGAEHDFLAIEGSEINGNDELLDTVIQAVEVLEPEALAYFKEHQPSKSSVALSQLTKMINKSSDPSSTGNASSKNGADPGARAQPEAAARAMLREVRSTLNDYRDKRWEGLVRQRSRLLKAIAVTGIVTHALLCITILAGIPPVAHQQFTPLQSGILAATMFYMVGAIAGLFVRFYSESQGGASVDDFGLSTTRLIAIPVLSGLAGILGVLVAEMLAGLGGPALLGSALVKSLELPTLFSLDPRLLLTAAIFGIAPNLVIKGLQQKANKYENELQSSKAAET